jgi:anti-sigma factor RsiW
MNPVEPNALPRELKAQLTRHIAPPGLKRRISFMVEQQARAAQAASPGYRFKLFWRRAWLPSASFALGAVVASLALQWLPLQVSGDSLQQQLVEGHVRSLMAQHLTDVASSDQHTVKPWFVGKLDYAPPVTDLASDGYPLAGGRLDSLQSRAVAALVYKRHAHTINLFVRPANGAPQEVALSTQRGYNLARWRAHDMEYLAVSDLNSEELKTFAGLLQARQTGADTR